jgi:transposase-like protein
MSIYISEYNGIDAFRNFAKRRLSKFNGLNNDNFIMHLKEYEFLYNDKNKDLVKILTKMVNK